MAKRTTHEQRVSKAARDVVDRRAGALLALADADEQAPAHSRFPCKFCRQGMHCLGMYCRCLDA